VGIFLDGENVNRSTLNSLFPTPHITFSDVRYDEQAAISAALHLIAMGNKPLGWCFSEAAFGGEWERIFDSFCFNS
jgi:hypothetical protein